MATLVSPGVSVTIVDNSYYVPASAPTVPLIFVGTRANKFQPDGVTAALGTQEHSVVRTVTSINTSTQLYGIPYFRTDTAGNQLNGDSRNEYGLFALNQFLAQGNVAYVVRADVDLTDGDVTTLSAGTPAYSGTGNGSLSGFTINQATAQAEVWTMTCNATPTAWVASTAYTVGALVTANGYLYQCVVAGTSGTTAPSTLGTAVVDGSVTWASQGNASSFVATFAVSGFASGPQGNATVGTPYNNGLVSFTITAGSTAFVAGDTFQVVITAVTVSNPLGANDAAKRVTITTALSAEINSNQDVRSELYEYNLILCPGYPECVDELLALNDSINDEAFVIADTPNYLSPEDTATWAVTIARQNNDSVAYYYPYGMATGLDGVSVFVAASGIALSVYAYSDNVSEVWFPPAGPRRGLVSGVTDIGYVTGTLGTATTFVSTPLNQGQRDILYQTPNSINPIPYFPGSGIMVFGQKTSASLSSALDRVNVMRLLTKIKRDIRKAAFAYLFELNDAQTQASISQMINSYLNDIMVRRGLYDYIVVCDSTNNTPTTIDNNQLWVDIALQPEKAIEFIYIPINVVSTGASLTSST